MTRYEVSSMVSSPRNDTPACAERVMPANNTTSFRAPKEAAMTAPIPTGDLKGRAAAKLLSHSEECFHSLFCQGRCCTEIVETCF